MASVCDKDLASERLKHIFEASKQLYGQDSYQSDLRPNSDLEVYKNEILSYEGIEQNQDLRDAIKLICKDSLAVKLSKKLAHKPLNKYGLNSTCYSYKKDAEYGAVQNLPLFIAEKSNVVQKTIQGSTTLEQPISSAISALEINRRHVQQDSFVARKHAVRPEWHPPWKLFRVISGHLGWVRCLDVEPGNQWFCSGAGDRTIKIWDLASGNLKLTLTGHLAAVRGVAISHRHPYLFSCGEDKMVKCWDLESNKVIRHYHGHLSGVYSLSIHPTLDLLVSSGRDAVARVWDIRSKQCVHVLGGHKATVCTVKCQATDPQVITGSMDKQIRLWDLAAGKTMITLTHHKKSIRDITLHPTEYSFVSASADNIKQWKLPEGSFMHNFQSHDSIVNTVCVNVDGVMFSGADNGSMQFYDWKSGHCFQTMNTIIQPGSLDSEAGIFSSCFDQTGLRLITGEADKSIKIYKQDDDATVESHPLNWTPSLSSSKY